MEGKQHFDRLSFMWFIWWVLSLSLPTHLCDHLNGKTGNGRFIGVTGSRAGVQLEFMAWGLALHPLLQVQIPTLSWHDRGSERSPMVSTHRGPATSNPMLRTEVGQLPLKKIYGSCLHLSTPHMPHRHITTHIDLHIPPFVQLCFLPSGLPKLLSVLKISVT